MSSWVLALPASSQVPYELLALVNYFLLYGVFLAIPVFWGAVFLPEKIDIRGNPIKIRLNPDPPSPNVKKKVMEYELLGKNNKI